MGFVESAALILLGSVLSGLGVLIKRNLDRRDTREGDVERFVKQHVLLLEAHGMSGGPSRSEVEDLRQNLPPQAEAPDTIDTLLQASDVGIETQSDMNLRASDELLRYEALMNLVLDEFFLVLDVERAEMLNRAQDAWVRFRDFQAAVIAQPYLGGTMWPTVFHSERAGLTRARVEELQSWFRFEQEHKA